MNVAGPGLVLVLLFAIPFSLPAMLLMMPATFLGIHLANRFGWRCKRHFFVYAAVSTLLTTAALLPFSKKISVSFSGPEAIGGLLYAALSLGLSGGIAGLIYRSVINRSNSSAGGTTLF